MLHRILATADDRVLAAARIVLGIVMLPHGLQKTVGWFGGYGFQGTMDFFTGTMGIPALFAFLAILAESAGALALVTGTLGRIAAFGILSTMVVAALTSHVQNGFFMNWTGSQQGEGFEYHILAATLALVVVIRGSGAWSVDRVLAAVDAPAGQPRSAGRPAHAGV